MRSVRGLGRSAFLVVVSGTGDGSRAPSLPLRTRTTHIRVWWRTSFVFYSDQACHYRVYDRVTCTNEFHSPLLLDLLRTGIICTAILLGSDDC